MSSSNNNYNTVSHFITPFNEYRAEKEYEYALSHNEDIIKNIELRRLVMIYCTGICQCCDTPEGDTNTVYINNPVYHCDNMGYFTCNKKECNDKIDKHVSASYNSIYNTTIWKRVLYFAANNTNINVYRSNGSLETDWTIMTKDEKYIGHNLNSGFLTLLLCVKRLEPELYKRIPFEILEIIYNNILYSYNKELSLVFTYDLTPHVGVCKYIDGKLITKKVPLGSI